MTEFDGKVAIVTGTTGIGKAIALRLARGGAAVLACGIDTEANRTLAVEAASEKLKIQVRKCDVSAAADVEAAVLGRRVSIPQPRYHRERGGHSSVRHTRGN